MNKLKYAILFAFVFGISVLGFSSAAFAHTGDDNSPTPNQYCPETGELTYNEFQNVRALGLVTYTLSVDTTTHLATAVVSNTSGCTIPMSLSVYKMYDQVLSHQEFFDGTGLVSVPAHSTLTANMPTCMAQIDFWYGLAPTTLLDTNPYNAPPNPVVLGWKYIYNNSNSFKNASGDFCQHTVPTQNSCPVPDALGDAVNETIKTAPSGELQLQQVLTNGGYSLNASVDQTQYQVWNVSSGQEVTIDSKFVARYAAYNSVFGYYTDGNLSTFTPVFKTANIAGYESTPLSSAGPFHITVPAGASTLGFAIRTWNGVNAAGTVASQNSLNQGGKDQVIVYNPSSDKYVLAFEDIVGGDYDYNDLVVEISLGCSTPAPTPTTATVVADKIICDAEADLPNWGAGGPDITDTTASSFLASHPDCYEAVNWYFQWAPQGTPNPGDETDVAAAPWTEFAMSTPTEVPGNSTVWFREEKEPGYIPFTGDNTGNDVSAEFYCNQDVLHYDNYDFIQTVAGQTYHCVAWNVHLPSGPENQAPIADAGPDQTITLPTDSVTLDGSASTDPDGSITSYVWTEDSGPSTVDPDDAVTTAAGGLVEGTYVFRLTVTDNDGASSSDTVTITVLHDNGGGSNPECSDGIDNDGDNLVDASDPGCHTDGNPNNPDSYDPNDNDETNYQCSDNFDNDGDGLIDSADPGCHTDGDAGNPDSYVPTDDDETDQTGGSVAECSDGLDNDGDNLIDSADPGCHTDGDAGNPDSYDPNDNDETNGGGGHTTHTSHHGGSTPVGQVLAAEDTCGIYVTEYLRVGYKNDMATVMKVQQFLNNYMNAGLAVDGIYGPATAASVSAFQAAHQEKVLNPWGIAAATGIFYLTTETEVNNIMCPALNLPIPTPLVNWSQNDGNVPSHAATTQASSSTSATVHTDGATSSQGKNI